MVDNGIACFPEPVGREADLGQGAGRSKTVGEFVEGGLRVWPERVGEPGLGGRSGDEVMTDHVRSEHCVHGAVIEVEHPAQHMGRLVQQSGAGTGQHGAGSMSAVEQLGSGVDVVESGSNVLDAADDRPDGADRSLGRDRGRVGEPQRFDAMS